MKKQPQPERQAVSILIWSYDQARRAVPYIRSITRSLRDASLDVAQYEQTAKRLAEMPGRPDRQRIIAEADARTEAGRARDRALESLQELQQLDLFCLDPMRGEALIPFVQDNELAWFVFDMFDDEDALRSWRFQKDPLSTRRPIAEAYQGVPQLDPKILPASMLA